MRSVKSLATIVYYGPLGSGKVTNLFFLQKMLPGVKPMLSYDTAYGRHPFITGLEGRMRDHGLELSLDFTLVTTAYSFDQEKAHDESLTLLRGGRIADGVVFVADSRASHLHENLKRWKRLQEVLRQHQQELSTFPLVMQWNKRDTQDALPVSVLEKHLNPSHVPSFEAIAVTGQGVKETWQAMSREVIRRATGKKP